MVNNNYQKFTPESLKENKGNKKTIPVMVNLIFFLFIFFLGYFAGVFKDTILRSFPFPKPGETEIIGLNNTPKEKPLDKYKIENLKSFNDPGKIQFDNLKEETINLCVYYFSFNTQGKKVTGLANVPKKSGKYPVILIFRGFVSQEIYTPGMGSKNTAEKIAQNGFITLAPDFLGYGGSDSESSKPIEARFETYTTALSLFQGLSSLDESLENLTCPDEIAADQGKTGIWAHSNGGQIALTLLEASGAGIPAVLWAPVTKPFPFNILYFTDEVPDKGKFLRELIKNFEKDYDSLLFSPSEYFELVSSPIQLHQGLDDREVPFWWSDDFYEEMKELEKEITYYKYPGENHNFNLGSAPLAISRAIDFYRENFAE